MGGRGAGHGGGAHRDQACGRGHHHHVLREGPGAPDRAGTGVRLSAKGEYAITALLDLAMHDKEGLQPIQEIASRQGIPQRYLEQVLLQLKRAGLLESRRGSSGGYRLSRPADQVTVGTVLRAVEDSVGGAGSARRGASGHDSMGDLSDLWREISEAVSAVVDRLTLDDLRRRAEDRRSKASPMYHI